MRENEEKSKTYKKKGLLGARKKLQSINYKLHESLTIFIVKNTALSPFSPMYPC